MVNPREWTPGPDGSVVAADGEVICTGLTPAHQRLVLAAPLMLAFLQVVSTGYGSCLESHRVASEGEDDTESEAINEAIDALEDADSGRRDYARQLVLFAEGMGGGALLPFPE